MSIVLITGCSSGFGLEAAVAFAEHGDTVVATMRNTGKADALQKKAADAGVSVEVEALDVTDAASVAACVQTVLDRHGRIDVLVNNAGVAYGGPIETIPLDTAQRLFDTNFWGAIRMIQAVVPGMRERRQGVVINVGSLSGRIPGALYTGMYAAGKHALGTITESLAGETAPFGLRAVCIEPGFFATEITNNAESEDEGVAGTEYVPDHEWWSNFMSGSVDSGADPRVVADAIVDASVNPDTPVRREIGDDADLYLALWKDTGTFESWMEAAIPVVEATAGPRPG